MLCEAVGVFEHAAQSSVSGGGERGHALAENGKPQCVGYEGRQLRRRLHAAATQKRR
jgi:hypothetical protein